MHALEKIFFLLNLHSNNKMNIADTDIVEGILFLMFIRMASQDNICCNVVFIVCYFCRFVSHWMASSK